MPLRSLLLRLVALASLTFALACPKAPEPPLLEPPVLAPIDPLYTTPMVAVGGTKPAGTGILVEGEEALPLDAGTTWSLTLALPDGPHALSFASFDALGRRSSEVSVVILVDTTPPSRPWIDPLPAATVASRLVLEGTKEASSTVLVNDAEAEAVNDVTWRHEVDLTLGENTFLVWARDAGGNESAAVRAVVQRVDFGFGVDPLPALVNDPVLEVSGTRGPDVAVFLGEEQRISEDAEGERWSFTVNLEEGENPLVIAGVHGDQREEASAVVVLDTTPPEAPALEPVPALTTEAWITLRGTKEADTGIAVGGLEVAPLSAETTFEADVPLAPGQSTLDVRAFDEAGNLSEPASPAPTVYSDPLGIYLTVDPVPAVVDQPTLVLFGRRNPDAEVRIGGRLVTPAGGAPTWSGTVTLDPDVVSSIAVTASIGQARRTIVVEVTYAASPPAPPVLSAPALTNASPVTVTGQKPAGAGVVREDGSPVAPVDDTTTLLDEAPLAEGENTITYFARDAFGRLSAPASVFVRLDTTPPSGTLATPAAGVVVGASLDVQGSANDDVGVDEVAVCLGPCASPNDYTPAGGVASFFVTLDTTGLPPSLDGTMIDLYLRVRDDAGNVYDAPPREVMLMRRPLPLSADPAFSQASPALDLAVGPARQLAAVFSHPASPSGSDVWLLLTDGRTVGGAAMNLTEDAAHGVADEDEPCVARATSGRVHVLFTDDGAAGSGAAGEPGLVHLSYDGATLSAPLAVQTFGVVRSPDVALLSGGGLVAVWEREDPGTGERAIELSVYDGVAWSAVQTVAADGDGTSTSPSRPRVAASADDLVHVVWEDTGSLDGAAGDADVYYRRFQPGDGTFGPARAISVDDAELADATSTAPAIAAVAEDPAHRVYVAWIETGPLLGAGAGVPKALFRAVDDTGLGPLFDASDVPGRSLADEVDVAASDDGAADIVFRAEGDIAGTGPDGDVFLRRFDGAVLAAEVHPVSDLSDNATSTEESRLVRVAVDGLGNRHVLWLERANLEGTIAGVADADVFYFAVGKEAP